MTGYKSNLASWRPLSALALAEHIIVWRSIARDIGSSKFEVQRTRSNRVHHIQTVSRGSRGRGILVSAVQATDTAQAIDANVPSVGRARGGKIQTLL
jgi:hypothetical protein